VPSAFDEVCSIEDANTPASAVPIDYAFDAVNSFRGFYYAEGWAHDGSAAVPPELLFESKLLPVQTERVDRPDLGALSAPALCGFRLRYIIRDGEAPRQFVIRFRTTTEQISVENPGLELFHRSLSTWRATEQAFFSRLRPGASILELGARARSGISRRGLFKDLRYTGFDIKDGENVDVVGDAHRLTSIFEPGQFDYAYSISVFEHLLWPWKAALELNAILKTGGVVLTQSHQTWPRHDAPWDFFRFSASSWSSLFCNATGFRIVQAADDMLAHVIAAHFMGDPNLELSEQAAFLVSICVAEKIGNPLVRWDADPDYRSFGDYPA
jgi:SAM-dependent methyltransferase